MRYILCAAVSCFLGTARAETGWTSLHCQKAGDSAFLQIAKDADGRVHVETNETIRYLLGLDCKIPNPAEPIFFCRGTAAGGLVFASSFVHERGFPQDEYDRYVDREQLEIYLSFTAKNGNGQNTRQLRTWKFEKNDCVGSGQ